MPYYISTICHYAIYAIYANIFSFFRLNVCFGGQDHLIISASRIRNSVDASPDATDRLDNFLLGHVSIFTQKPMAEIVVSPVNVIRRDDDQVSGYTPSSLSTPHTNYRASSKTRRRPEATGFLNTYPRPTP
jgi:hypothetical protein